MRNLSSASIPIRRIGLSIDRAMHLVSFTRQVLYIATYPQVLSEELQMSMSATHSLTPWQLTHAILWVQCY